MILLFTDFGATGPYQAQMIASIRKAGYQGDVLSLFAEAPVFSPAAAGHLLAAYAADFPEGSVFLSIVDPGVGTDRRALVVKSNNRWFVGPDNGLLEQALRRDANAAAWEIVWRPDSLSASFHGRDLFAPIAARIKTNSVERDLKPIAPEDLLTENGAAELSQIIYIDHYGNAMTGLVGANGIRRIRIKEVSLPLVRVFSDVAVGEPLAYVNANGLIEIAVNQGRADAYFGLTIGSQVMPLIG
ncbi:SAM hydrolase/SAM-dependent halogenase family protein [Sneathiella aquimaris]|uniref:SAM hydrolase/SAM-dependent halogenase family protein n=1 Tax=Sneathiella aquimaris TaxID=2599305 RepID=UPI00146EBADA|nr:SAM-dependent chlorinase/fluorinase [Sneathiella aquimaris]